jgi:hypothetical protein
MMPPPGYWVSLNSWIVILARLFCLAREESLNPGPFARQPRARVTENNSPPVLIAESDPPRELGFAKQVNILSDSARTPSRCVPAQLLDDGDSPIFWFDLSKPFDENPGNCGFKSFRPQRHIQKKDED